MVRYIYSPGLTRQFRC